MYSSAALQRQLYLMASKRLRQLAGTGTRSIATETPAVRDSLDGYIEHFAQMKLKRERVENASRAITFNSKTVISEVQRIDKINRDEVLETARKHLSTTRDLFMSKLVTELHGTDFWELRESYSPGVQEYVEAATLYKFCSSGNLLDLEEINASLLPLSDPSSKPFQIGTTDYILGVIDMTEELMRLGIKRASVNDLDYAEKICRFVQNIRGKLMVVVLEVDASDVKKKIDTMFQSERKLETACFEANMRLMGTDMGSGRL